MTLSLKATNISKSYNGNQVLKGCDFSFDNSGIYVLTGANGCGKSTFLRLCALIEAPDSGEINYYVKGGIFPKDLELRRRITLVLPKVGVFNTTVFRNVAYGLWIRGIKGKKAAEKVNDALEFVGLRDKKNQNGLTLSSGETQRLGIARAVVTGPDMLFLDEPTASVDQRNTAIIEDIILRMKIEGRATVIITTHDKEQAGRLADSLLLMHDGKISRQ